jgi:UDP-glucose 4-epimerase
MNILVTGGAGYIGSHTAKALAIAGHQPIVIDNLTNGHEWAVQWGPFEHGDLGDVEWLRGVLSRHRIEGVIHFAASAYVGESMTDPRK